MSINQFFLPFSNLNDSESNNVLSESDHHLFPLTVINELKFNRFNFNDGDTLNDHVLHEPVCDYYFCDTILPYTFPSHSLKLLSYNISSIPLHFDTFIDQCLEQTNINFDVIGFCETRLNDAVCSLYNLSNFNAHFKNKNTHGGGVAIFLHKCFSSVLLHNISLQLPHVESLFIKVTQPFSFITGMIYRPPNANYAEFLSSIESIAEYLVNQNLPCYMMGDFNVNLLKNDNKAYDLINLLFSHYFFPTITKPTRVTATSASLIDHIWTSNLQNHQVSGIYYTSISDHFPVFSVFSVDDNHRQSSKITVSKRLYNCLSTEAFKSDLSNYNWMSDMVADDVNASFDNYMKKFLNLYNHHYPLKQFTCKEKHINKPYITPAIKTSIKHRNKLQKLYAKWPLTYGKTFKQYRNTLTSLIRSAKENYYKSKLKENTGNTKKTWDIVNTIMGKSSDKKLPNFVSFHDHDSYSNQEIAESFNAYFSNVANRLAMNIQEAPDPFTSYMPEPAPFSFFLRPTLLPEIKSVITNLKVTAAGFDDVHVKVLKQISNEISPFFVYIINRSFKEGCFPKHLQVARIVPVLKKGDKTLHTNYRPVSILPSFSKIFEKIVALRLMDYISKCSILSDTQFGFRPGYSTQLALHHLCQNIHKTLDNKGYQISVFCDLSKAFDTISHSILLHKLKIYGIRGIALSWFKSYLGFRKHCTVYDYSVSSFTFINYGVPQGSILGPILFLIYINDITRCSNKLEFLLFADDTTISIQGQDLNYINDTLNTELINVSNWIKSNKLTLNISKTYCMLFLSLMIQPINIHVYIDNLELEQVEVCKFLGVNIDSKLKWKFQVNEITTKISKLVGVLYKIRNSVTNDCLREIYISLAYPHFLYCSTIWGGTFNTFLDSLFITQKKLMRVMSNSQRYAHTDPLFKNYKLLKVNDIIKLQTLLFIHKALYSHEVDCNFQFLSDNKNSRRPNDLKLPLCRTSHAQRYITYRGANQWNQLPEDLKNIKSFNIFKFKIKQLFLRNY